MKITVMLYKDDVSTLFEDVESFKWVKDLKGNWLQITQSKVDDPERTSTFFKEKDIKWWELTK